MRAERLKRLVFLSLIAVVFALFAGDVTGRQQKDESERVRLGERLFRDDRFSTRAGDFVTACSDCHFLDENAQGLRAFTDFLARSWVPWRSADPRRDGLRNAPTLFDVAEMPTLHLDGEFGSLEELVKGTLSGRPLGWLPGEEPQAFRQAYLAIVNDEGSTEGVPSYREQFKKAYGTDPAKLSQNEVIDLVAGAVSDFLRTLKTERASPYDRFVRLNGLEVGPRREESPKAFADRMLARLSSLESKGELKLGEGFSAAALDGMKIFFRTGDDASSGNCVSCHTPPLFTDFDFHNIGVSQSEYDRLHGEGSFARLKIPDASEAVRPAAMFREIPSRNKPGIVDLGYWNYVKLSDLARRRAGESEDRFLRRMIATFKTPTLRNLALSEPYLHNGAVASLEGVLSELMRLSEMARAGRVREADEELSRIRITQADIPRLVAFLNSLNERLNLPGRAARKKAD